MAAAKRAVAKKPRKKSIPKPKPKPSVASKAAEVLSRPSYLVDYDTTMGPCTCNADETGDYCRCRKIVSTKVNSVNVDRLVSQLFTAKRPSILKYCVDRIFVCNRAYNPSVWTVNVHGGYYGEETSGAYMEDSLVHTICEDIRKVEGMSEPAMVKFVLTLEYGYVLDMLKDTKKAEIVSVSPKQLVLPQNEYRHKVCETDLSHYEKRELPVAVCVAYGFGPIGEYKLLYSIVDGYHRTLAAMKNGSKKMKIVVMS